MTAAPAKTAQQHNNAPDQQPAHPPPLRRSAWTTRQKLTRVIWSTLGRLLWTILPGARSALLRLFGATVGSRCTFARTVDIIIPWNITIGDDVQVGDRAILYSLGRITLGDRVVLDCRAHLCAGTHDFTDSRFPLLTPPIKIGEDSFIGIDAYVGPDVVLGKRCIVWPRASVYKSCGDDVVLQGNPAKPIDRATVPESAP